MKLFSLQFIDVFRLLEFIDVIKATTFSVNLDQLTVTGNIQEAELELALQGFDAIIVRD